MGTGFISSPLSLLQDAFSSSPFSTFVLTLLALVASYRLGIAVYNVFFHPLRNFPGPKSCAVSSIPWVSTLFTGTAHKWNHALHQKYGPVVRFAPNKLSFIDGRAWKDIHGFKKPGPYKDILSYGVPPNGTPGLLSEVRDEEHARMRKVFTSAFSEKALKEQEPLFLQYIDLLVAKLTETIKNNPSEKVDMVRMLNFTTFDIMGDLTFGEPLGLLERSDYTPWVALIFQALKFGTYLRGLQQFTFFRTLFKLWMPKTMEEKRNAHFRFSIDQVNKRLQAKEERPDIWGLVLRQGELGRGLSLKEMHSNAALFMGAGTETTATELSGLLYFLLKNPEKMTKLVAEVRGKLASDEDITMEHLSQLKYMHACIDEGLRVYPPVPIGLPRVIPRVGSQICDEFVPGGSEVCITQYSTYHSPLNFTRPDSFEPERWLQPTPVAFANDQRSACQPFSQGPRNCVGQNMALHEMRLILAKILWHFDFSLSPESEGWAETQRVYALWEKKPLIVGIKIAKR